MSSPPQEPCPGDIHGFINWSVPSFDEPTFSSVFFLEAFYKKASSLNPVVVFG